MVLDSNVVAESVLALTPYSPAAGSSRVRVYDWIRWCGDPQITAKSYTQGLSAGLGNLSRDWRGVVRSEKWLRNRPGLSAHTILVHREASPFSRGRLESKILQEARFGVFDFDDALQWDSGRLSTRLFPKALKVTRAVQSADCVIAGNDVLADWAAGHNQNVVVIPSCVNPSEYLVKTSYAVRPKAPCIVWMGSPTTEQYLRTVERPLLALHKEIGARLTVISRGCAALGELDKMIDRVDWTIDGFANELIKGDVGIAPLADSQYARGKCAYKLLQYGASGLPVVGSPIGANSVALDRMGGAAPQSDPEWFEALHSILTAADGLRQDHGRAARKGVVTNYAFSVWEASWRMAVGLPNRI